MAALLLSLLMLAFGMFGVVISRPEQGVWDFTVGKNHTMFYFAKSLFSKSQISLSVLCEGTTETSFTIEWLVRQSPCANEYIVLDEEKANTYLTISNYTRQAFSYNWPWPYKKTEFLKHQEHVSCKKPDHINIRPLKYTAPQVEEYVTKAPPTKKPEEEKKQPSTEDQATGDADAQKAKPEQPQEGGAESGGEATKSRRRRAADDSAATPAPATQAPEKPATTAATVKTTVAAKDEKDQLLRVWADGYYLLVLRFIPESMGKFPDDFKLKVTVKMSDGNRYIGAVDWPLLIFYGVMGLVYIFYGIFWLVMLACNWRDLLRVQFWIGGVIFLGMLEKAVFFGEYESINNTGQSVRGAIIFAELVSCLKRTLARMLVIIVSLGYGIVKPRLGQTFHKVLIVGFIFFILASIEGCSRAVSDKADQSTKVLVASVPLAVTDAIICWWIFSSLLQTTRTLRLRRNVVKLSLYRHFTNTLIFSVIASIAYMIWFMTQHQMKECLTDWEELWMDEAFWHLLFSVILFIIMILWRPSANNQRYAFSPLLDAAEDEIDDDQVLSDAYEGMKMRPTTNSKQRNGSPKVRDDKEDDLKWVEENIPSSLADRVLPALDSDEEIMNTKFEVSKME